MTERQQRCQDIVELLNDYLDGTLDPVTRAIVDDHLAGCEGCVAFLAQLQLAGRLTARLEPDQVPEPVMNELLRVFRTSAAH